MRISKMLLGVGCVWFVGVTASSGFGQASRPQALDNDDAKKQAAIHRCVDYSQEQDEDGMRLHLKNDCGFDLQCSMSWEVVCLDDDDSLKKGASVFFLENATRAGAYASAAACGDEGWRVRKIRWSCADDQDTP